MSARAPLIGFTLDYEETPTYSKMPWYALRENYCASVARLGATPIALPHEVERSAHYLDLIDGLVVTGGAFDVPPELYGDTNIHASVTVKQRRSAFEIAMTRGMVERRKPVLGICGGQQLLNVVLGGTLIQHIPDTIQNPLAHEQPNPRDEPGHTVTVWENTLLHRIVGRSEIEVNSAHHQAVALVAPGMLINAVAPDGVIEGIELPESRHPFCLGVQWHPEYHVTAADEQIFSSFLAACQR